MDPWVHIIGGGLSGLSLASSLARFNDLPGRVVISEPNPEALASKTFSFWFSGDEEAFLRPQYLSSCWTLSDENHRVAHQGTLFQYGTRPGDHVLDSALQEIHNHPQIDLVHEFIDIRPKATHCFDSRPCAVDTFQLTQSFAGIEVIFEQPHGILEAGLMERMRPTDS